jgi:hypothetical protein
MVFKDFMRFLHLMAATGGPNNTRRRSGVATFLP